MFLQSWKLLRNIKLDAFKSREKNITFIIVEIHEINLSSVMNTVHLTFYTIFSSVNLWISPLEFWVDVL